MTEEKEVDFEEWAILLCQLLDKIDAANKDQEVAALLQLRFQIAREMGLEVRFVPHSDNTPQQ